MDKAKKPIVQKFKILGLHGYKDVVIDFETNVRIVIAENGAGKTTILSALYAFLTCRFNNLRNIDFEEIRCKFHNQDEELSLKKKNLIEQGFIDNDALDEIASYSDVTEDSCIEFLSSEFDPDNYEATRFSSVGRELFENSPWDWEQIHEILCSAHQGIMTSLNEETQNIIKQVKAAIGDTEVLYLPTYRRIERLFDSQNTSTKRNLGISYKRQVSEKINMNARVNYGLADVEERLAALTEDVQRRTNMGYRIISASIIDDLLSGKANTANADFSKLPDIDTLTLFFSRVGSVNFEGNFKDRIKEIYDNPKLRETGDRATLIYFLSKLSQVVDQTKQLESIIENFVTKSNIYLGATSDKKTFTYDPETMKVKVVNKWTDKEVKLNDLSSGEKQVVSLLAYLFLYPSEKLILIDEPELSLSIDWQQKILVDIATAPSCQQLLAITHSPFIFDNELDFSSTSLQINRKKQEQNKKG